ncbi:hypothetical protein EIMP300_60450 [Escherichia coli]|uniref:Nudix hydrolase domain-containing protein n=1 Tax=Escherichia coli TaxID=562 RepID=A0A8S0FVZ2_ECOLX|nr:hypothetical protein EIMP300_60450 [Escherichia coli]
MFKPHVTVACVVHAEGKFLVVEETINGKALWNQPAGHLEADETLVEAAARELWEETGISAQPQHFIRMHQWIAPDKTPFLRFLFAIELEQICPTQPHDSDIDCCRWVSAEEILQRCVKSSFAAGGGKYSLLSKRATLSAGDDWRF